MGAGDRSRIKIGDGSGFKIENVPDSLTMLVSYCILVMIKESLFYYGYNTH